MRIREAWEIGRRLALAVIKFTDPIGRLCAGEPG